MKLEICANSLQSALNAQEAGADRIELCENLNEGGTTPSYGTIYLARKHLKIPIHVLIRPRAGNFLYTESEFEIMKQDVLMCKELACEGVVLGLLNINGSIDTRRTKMLVELASPMNVTFHRAFDSCRDPEEALEDIIKSGCQRILTSGMRNTAEEGASLLKHLVAQAGDRILIMPGSGINSGNIARLKNQIQAKEWHASAKSTVESNMEYQNTDLANMGHPPTVSSAREIEQILANLR